MSSSSKDGGQGMPPADRQSGHPDLATLQRVADGAIGPTEADTIERHLNRCAECHSIVEQMRRSNASIALASEPPSDLLARIRARRASSGRVSSPEAMSRETPSDARATSPSTVHPELIDLHHYADEECDSQSDASLVDHVANCDQCLGEVEAARRGSAALSLLSRPPTDLLDRIRARHRSGERVLLPEVPPHAYVETGHLPSRHGRRDRGRSVLWSRVGSVAIAAGLVIAVGLGLLGRTGRFGGNQAVAVTSQDSIGGQARGGGVGPTRGNAGNRTVAKVTNSVDNTQSMSFKGKSSRLGGDSLSVGGPASSAEERAQWLAFGSELSQFERTHAGIRTYARSAAAEVELDETLFVGAGLTPEGAAALRELGAIVQTGHDYHVALVSTPTATGELAPNVASRTAAIRAALIAGGLDSSRIEPVRERKEGGISTSSARRGTIAILVLPHAR